MLVDIRESSITYSPLSLVSIFISSQGKASKHGSSLIVNKVSGALFSGIIIGGKCYRISGSSKDFFTIFRMNK